MDDKESHEIAPLGYANRSTPIPPRKPESFRFTWSGIDDLPVTMTKWLIGLAFIAYLVAVLVYEVKW